MNQDELKVLEERIKANPKSRSFLQLAEAYVEAGRRAEALELLKNGEEYYPYYLAARIAYGKLLREEGEVDRAIEQFEFVNRTIPDNLLALKNLAELYLAKDRFSESADMADAALALSPNDPEMLEVLSKAAGSTPAPAQPPSIEEAPVETPELEETIVEMPHELFVEATRHDEPVSTPEPSVNEPIEGLHEEEPKPLIEEEHPVAAPTQESDVPSSANLPQTETMGDLLFDQGHLEEALSVYEAAIGRDSLSETLPEKIRTVKTMLRMVVEPPSPSIPIESLPESSEQEPSRVLPPEAVTEKRPPIDEEPPPVIEPEKEEIVEALETMSHESVISHRTPDGVAGQVIDRIRDRMGRELIGYVRSTLDGLSTEASDNGHWADVLAAEGVEIVRAVSEMTHMLNWGTLHGTVVWMDRAILYGLPVESNEALFLALKPGANVGLCRLLISQVIDMHQNHKESQG